MYADRNTALSLADVTTTFSTLMIRFDAYLNQPDHGLTANPCWPSTLVDDPGFALLNSDPWYYAPANAQRHQIALRYYPAPPPLVVTQNNPPRQGWKTRSIGLVGVDLILVEGNSTTKLTGEGLDQLFLHGCEDADCVEWLKQVKILPVASISSSISSSPMPNGAIPTAADTNGPAATSTASMVGGSVQGAFELIAKPTGSIEQP